MVLEKETGTVTAQHEWLARGKSSILKIIKDVPIAELPLMQKILDYNCRILHEDKPSIQLFESHSTLNTAVKKCISAPIHINGKISGFLCIENPKIHTDDIALLTALMPVAALQQTRYETGYLGENNVGWDVLTGLMNFEAYTEMLHKLNADIYLSLGVLRMDIYSLNRINAIRGKAFGNKLLLFATKAMTRIFDEANVYRISGQAFALLYPNVLSQVFMENCQQLQTELDSRYPGIFNLGYTWAEKHFTAHKLVENAEKIMQYNIQSLDVSSKFAMLNQADALIALKSGIVNGRYVVYIQSKNRIDTGQVVGGEVLVRYLDPKRGIIAPDEFIERMEKENIIRDLDFYVFEQTLQIMHNWKLHGRKLMPISVNFSRQTLLDRSALSYLLDIHNRYDIPAEMIEIEITESIGNIEQEVIARAVKSLKEHGFKLSLDDFGAAYSNLSLLTSVSFDSVKLDKGIITNFTVNKINNTIVECMIKICDSMNAMCIAEGVETKKQAQALLQAGCKYAQGYYYDKPMPANDFEKKYLTN
jgi:EAL domain-containing protein (putative c-di-GMP-specific phosphodiesterase class I)